MYKTAVLTLTLLLTLLLSNCGSEPVPLPPDMVEFTLPEEITVEQLLASQPTGYLPDLQLTPTEANYFSLINEALPLTEAELALLAQNGFVVTDQQAWNRFIEAYAWIYWQDLPVLITTDSILHAVHQSYSDILQSLEQVVLMPRLQTVLTATQSQLRIEQQADENKQLEPLYEDLLLYLAVAEALLVGETAQIESNEVRRYISWARAADSYEEVVLFGNKRMIDFTLFQPRGHYAPPTPDYENYELANYFRAMSWLAHLDFRFVTYDPKTSQPELHTEEIMAAVMLHYSMAASGQGQTWAEMDAVLQALVGRSDNMTLADLERFLSDIQAETAVAMADIDSKVLLTQLTENDYGQQRITGQLIYRHIENTGEAPIPRPVNFALMGQRFALDAYVMGQLVYDRLLENGVPVERPLPEPLDVMYVLGNDRALAHLADPLNQYHYQNQLEALRFQVDTLEPTFWQDPIYNQWLRMIRSLNPTMSQPGQPPAMQTAAWADKTLQTQLASWAQLRHDHLLYAKQSFTTVQVLCVFPDWYVEPYPEFYEALGDYAVAGEALLAQIPAGDRLATDVNVVREQALAYFERIGEIATQLQSMSEKALRGEAFTEADDVFIQNTIIRHLEDNENFGCGEPRFNRNMGWLVPRYVLCNG